MLEPLREVRLKPRLLLLRVLIAALLAVPVPVPERARRGPAAVGAGERRVLVFRELGAVEGADEGVPE